MEDPLRDMIQSLRQVAIPQLSVNVVIMGYAERRLQVVVNRLDLPETTLDVLPGGFIRQDEDLSHAVERITRETTGLENLELRQFDVFGSATRQFRDEFHHPALRKLGMDDVLIEWLSRRFLSLGYLALVDYSKTQLQSVSGIQTATWKPMEEAASLAMDHPVMVASARQYLLRELPYSPIAAQLLPTRFTLPDLQALVEAILQRPVDRPNFRRKMLATGMIVKVGEESSATGKGRPADVYKFKHGKKTALISEWKPGF